MIRKRILKFNYLYKTKKITFFFKKIWFKTQYLTKTERSANYQYQSTWNNMYILFLKYTV